MRVAKVRARAREGGGGVAHPARGEAQAEVICVEVQVARRVVGLLGGSLQMGQRRDLGSPS